MIQWHRTLWKIRRSINSSHIFEIKSIKPFQWNCSHKYFSKQMNTTHWTQNTLSGFCIILYEKLHQFISFQLFFVVVCMCVMCVVCSNQFLISCFSTVNKVSCQVVFCDLNFNTYETCFSYDLDNVALHPGI